MLLGTRGWLACPMQLAWEVLLAQNHTNREMFQAQRQVIQVQREAQGRVDEPYQEDELHAWFHDAQVGGGDCAGFGCWLW